MLTAFDVGFAILVLISAILATARGLTREVLSLATWAGSAAIAVFMWKYHPEIAEGYIKDPTIAAIATVIVSFLVSLIVLHLVTMRIADFVVDSRIGPIDRSLGFVFGVLRGVLIAVVVVIFGQWLVPGKLPPWASESRSLPVLTNMGDSLIAALPPDLEGQVTSLLKHGPENTAAGEPADADESPEAGPNDNPDIGRPDAGAPSAPGTAQPAPDTGEPDAGATPGAVQIQAAP